jgi:hypothetical protein
MAMGSGHWEPWPSTYRLKTPIGMAIVMITSATPDTQMQAR